MVFCPKCGNQVEEGTKFCGNCGQSVLRADQEPAVTARKPPPRHVPWKTVAIVAVLIVALTAAAVFIVVPQIQAARAREAEKYVNMAEEEMAKGDYLMASVWYGAAIRYDSKDAKKYTGRAEANYKHEYYW